MEEEENKNLGIANDENNERRTKEKLKRQRWYTDGTKEEDLVMEKKENLNLGIVV